MKREDILRIVVKDTVQIDSNLSLFFNDFFELFIHKKIKRIAQAVFLVTEHIDNNDPIKENVRSLSLRINRTVIKNNKTLSLSEKRVNYMEILTDVISLFSVFEIAVVAGVINETNYLLISKELSFLIETLNDKIVGFEQKNSSISREFFRVDLPKNNTNIEHSNIKDKSNIIQKDINFIKDKEIKGFFQGVNSSSENQNNSDIIQKDKDDKSIRFFGKLSKEESIKNIFKTGSKMTVKDVFILLPQYSEKTIQRELLRLVEVGVLGKEGKKRWTVYFLAGNKVTGN